MLLDEWQLAPTVLAAVKRAVDTRPASGSFLITGSVRSDRESSGRPLPGRALRVHMCGMTEREIHGDCATGSLLDRLAADGVDDLARSKEPPVLNEYIERALRSGLPDAVLAVSDRLRRHWLPVQAPR